MRKQVVSIVAILVLVCVSLAVAKQADRQTQKADGQAKSDPQKKKPFAKHSVFQRPRLDPTGVELSIEHLNYARQYRIHVPQSYAPGLFTTTGVWFGNFGNSPEAATVLRIR